MNEKTSILRNLILSFLGFGLAMGAIFPFYASLFVHWKEGMLVWFVIGCLVAGSMIGVVNYVLIKVMLLNKLQRIADVAHSISNNDITHTCGMHSNDLIGEIIKSFNKMAAGLREIIGHISDASGQLTNAAHSIKRLTDRTHDGVSQQRNQTMNAVSAMDEMVERIREVSCNSDDAAKSANDAHTAAEHGRTVVRQNIQTVDALVEEVSRAGTVMDELADHSREIGGVLDVIRGIAEQTNLLALNAAIEAARAGEQGRGFAVVADEVRTLATRTQQSTEEIQKMIAGLQQKAAEAVDVMQRGSERASTNAEQAHQADEALEQITNAVGNISRQTSNIAAAAKAQEEVADRVCNTVKKIQKEADDLLGAAEEGASSGSELTTLTGRLQQIVSRFKL
jgi:methyl-accepting chemotaxis protein